MKISFLPLVLALAFASSAFAADRALADALTAAGSTQALKGNTAQARDLFFKALVNDDKCPDALLELARMFDKEGDLVSAGDFYQRAASLMAAENKPGTAMKRSEAEKRFKALNPYALKLGSAFEEFAQDVDRTVRRLPDPLTESSALESLNDLNLASILPPEKLPKFYAAIQSKKAAAAISGNTAATGTTPEVERELKAMGWTSVTGTWTKKAQGVYEARNGKLEAQKINGTLDFTILKEGTSGVVKATVRSEYKANGGWADYELPGFGVHYRGKDFLAYLAGERDFGLGGGRRGGGGGGGRGNNLFPVGPKSLGTYPAEAARNHFSVTASDNTIEVFYNEQRNNHTSLQKTAKGGPFILEVDGTVTIENPRCSGN